MHARNYGAAGIVAIPKLEARAALVLGEQLIAAAGPHRKVLAKNVAKALGGLRASTLALALALRDQVGFAADRMATKRSDRKIDGAWGALYDFLGALARLEDEAVAREAADLRAAVFPNGARFLLLPFLLEWSESEMALSRIERDGLAPRLVAIGGEVFLRAIRRAHKEYGLVLGIRAPRVEAPETPSVRDALGAFESALRVYVVRVAGWADHEDPGTEEAAAGMLLPLETWSLGGRATPSEEEDDGESGPEEETDGATESGGGPAASPAPPQASPAPPNPQPA